MRARQKSKGDKEYPSKILYLMSTGLDLRFSDLGDKNSVVFQLRIFDLRKLTNNSRYLII